MSSHIRLGNVELDIARESVHRDGVEHRLRHRTFEVLLHLVENRNRVVTKSELFEKIWRGVAVTEDTLVQSIVEIRKALGDDPRSPQFVRTIPRVGYQLIAPSDEVAVIAPPNGALTAPGEVQIEVAESRSVVVSIEESRDWRSFIPHIAIAIVIIALGTIAAMRLLHRPAVASAPTSSAGADRMTDSLDAYEAYRRGVVAADGLRTAEAVAYLEHAIKLDPGFAMAYARIGYAYGVTGGQTDRARPYFAKALSMGNRLDDRERLYVLGWQAISETEYARAIDHFRLLIARAPTDVEAYERLGKLLIGEERLNEAIDVLSRGLTIEDAPELHNSLGTAWSYLGRHTEAIAHHRQFVELRPNEPNSHDSLGLSYQWAGEYENALREYDKALQLAPRFEVARVHRANAYWAMGRNRDAVREYASYIAIAPSATERIRGWAEVAMIRHSLGDVHGESEAIDEMHKAGSREGHQDLMLAVDRGDVADAARRAKALRVSVIAGRGSRRTVRFITYALAQAARIAGDEEQAIAYARETLRHSPPTYLVEDCEDVLADMLIAFGRSNEAIAEYRRVLALNANRGRTRYKLARALEQFGRRAEADDEYAHFLRTWATADRDAPEMVRALARRAK
jgi:tetratricopeptide (TPR) repeat protein